MDEDEGKPKLRLYLWIKDFTNLLRQGLANTLIKGKRTSILGFVDHMSLSQLFSFAVLAQQ